MLDNPQQFLRSLPTTSGVYQMYDDKRQLLYVGKAKNLKQRLSNYFRPLFASKTKLFMEQVTTIEIILTPSENAALLLENNLIKTHKPRYNILFKDDKSFPYLLLSEHMFPRLTIYRGAPHKMRGKLFGPFPDGGAVKFMVNLLQRIFRLRVCQDNCMPVENKRTDNRKSTLHKMNSDTNYAGYSYRRSRPCMLYQIKLCHAPCVGYIEREVYRVQVSLAEQFLRQQNDEVVQKLTQLMETSSANLDYECAAEYRDQIASIHKMQTTQAIIKDQGNYDVVAVMIVGDNICINTLCIRRGLMIGNKHYFAKSSATLPTLPADALRAFILHYHLNLEGSQVLPDKILFNIKFSEAKQIAEVLRQKFKNKILLAPPFSKEQKQLISMSETNALHALTMHQHRDNNYEQGLSDFTRALKFSTLPQRIECFDVSHNVGEAQVVSCVVFDTTGPKYRDYRHFSVQTKSVGDDYAALQIALHRRYSSHQEIPDVIIVDGGVGQLRIVAKVCNTLCISNILLIAVAKGKERKPGLEKIYVLRKNKPLALAVHGKALRFIQMIRDIAHDFALTGHRKQMVRTRCKSDLENITGVGKMRSKALLQYFGGMRELRAAGVDDLMRIKGISMALAHSIYEYLHG